MCFYNMLYVKINVNFIHLKVKNDVDKIIDIYIKNN